MSEATIEVQRRERAGKSESRRLRKSDLIPAVLYGADKEPIAIQVPRVTLLDLFKEGGHENRIFLLKLSGTDQTRHAMVRDIQVDAMTNKITHLDFQRIAMDKKLRVRVHLALEGIPTGVKNDGGILDFVTREVEVECMPNAIPQEIGVDVSRPRRRPAPRRQRNHLAEGRRVPRLGRRGHRLGQARADGRGRSGRRRCSRRGCRRRSRRARSHRPRQEGRGEGSLSVTRLIAGLGNPGERYRDTRHNLGFRVVERLRERLGSGAESEACGALVSTAGELLLVRPQTYMNRSGWAVRCLAALHALPNDRILVVYDDVALPLGRLRLRPEGSPGGHRGMESVIASLRGQDVPRLRLGIAPPAPSAPLAAEAPPAPDGSGPDLAEFVLAPFAAEERAAVDALVERGAEAALSWAEEGAERAMAKFNALG